MWTMWSAPSEANMGDRLKCCKCYRVLPPCTSFNDFFRQVINQRHVYVYNGGQYYRPVGHHDAYECSDCFNEPIRVQESMRKEEEERRRQEEVRKRQEEERRREEEKRKEEEERKRGEENKLNIIDLLFHSLDGLKQAELSRFKTYLSEKISEFKPIPRGNLEGKGPTDVASMVLQAYGEDGSVKVTLIILRKMNLNRSADELQRATQTGTGGGK